MPMSSVARILKNSYRHVPDYENARKILYQELGELKDLDVLDAGCGASSHLALQNCRIRGIDISRDALNNNPNLCERICDDLETYDKESWTQYFDLIVCWDVLEHLQQPGKAIAKFAKWIKPGGRLVLVYPNPESLKGYVTKHTPYWFHRLFYKLWLGTASAQCEPVRTVIAEDLKLRSIIELMDSESFTLQQLISFESHQAQWVKKFLPATLVDRLNRRFLGKLPAEVNELATDFIVVASR